MDATAVREGFACTCEGVVGAALPLGRFGAVEGAEDVDEESEAELSSSEEEVVLLESESESELDSDVELELVESESESESAGFAFAECWSFGGACVLSSWIA